MRGEVGRRSDFIVVLAYKIDFPGGRAVKINLTTMQRLQAILDEIKTDIPDNVYLRLSNELTKKYYKVYYVIPVIYKDKDAEDPRMECRINIEIIGYTDEEIGLIRADLDRLHITSHGVDKLRNVPDIDRYLNAITGKYYRVHARIIRIEPL